jgi:hypothetical protein
MNTVEEYVMLVAYPEPTKSTEWPVVDIFGGEVIFDTDGTYEGYERGQWWESVVLDDGAVGVPAALDDIDTELTSRGYTRTSRWHGPKVTNRGERYMANALARLESVGDTIQTPSTVGP